MNRERTLLYISDAKQCAKKIVRKSLAEIIAATHQTPSLEQMISILTSNFDHSSDELMARREIMKSHPKSLIEIESGVIWYSPFWLSFHSGYPFWCLFAECWNRGWVKIYFISKSEKYTCMGREDLLGKSETDIVLILFVQFFCQWRARIYLKSKGRTNHYYQKILSEKIASFNN